MSEKKFRVDVFNPQGRCLGSEIMDEVNAIMKVADFPEDWKELGYRIKRTEIKEKNNV